MSVRINKGKVRGVEYRANGDIADAKETPDVVSYNQNDDIAGYVLREKNPAQNTNQERLYDKWGKKMAEVSYEYIPQMPFSLITESWNFTAGFSSIPMIRN